jgi:hypothetical protein
LIIKLLPSPNDDVPNLSLFLEIAKREKDKVEVKVKVEVEVKGEGGIYFLYFMFSI